MTEPPQSSGLTRRRAGEAQGTPGAPGTRRWNAESRWRAFLRPSDYRTPGSFDEASERFSLNLPYYLSQYAAIGALTVLGGALLSGGITFVLAVIVALLLTIIAISLTSRIELSNSTRFLVFLFVTSCSLFPNLLHTPFSCSLFFPFSSTVVSVVFWFTEDMRLGSQCFIIWFSSLFPHTSTQSTLVLTHVRTQSVSCTVCSKCPLRTRRPSSPAPPSNEQAGFFSPSFLFPKSGAATYSMHEKTRNSSSGDTTLRTTIVKETETDKTMVFKKGANKRERESKERKSTFHP